jgi:Helix-turn-helix domain
VKGRFRPAAQPFGVDLDLPLWAADSTGRRNTLTTAQAEGVLQMKNRTRTYYTATQKTLMWARWKDGWTLHWIGKLFDRPHTSIQGILSKTGGIRRFDLRRCALALTLAEREEISRALTVGQSMRSIAARLGRAPSTISREIGRNGGQHGYRATLADQAKWERALRPKLCKLAKNRALAGVVADMLRMLWSPEQIAG